jgi:hypothetical protein
MKIQISKPTSMPGERTTIAIYGIQDNPGDLRLAIGRAGKAIDWRVRQENEKKLELTRKRLENLKVKIPGFIR